MTAIVSGLLRLIEHLLAAILAVMATVVVYQVVARYVFHSPPSWTEELARYLQVWLVLLGAPVCLHRGMHLAVDYVSPALGPRPQLVVRIVMLVVVALYSAVMCVFGVRLLATAELQTSPALGLSMWWPYLAMPVSGVLCLAVALGLMRRALAERTA